MNRFLLIMILLTPALSFAAETWEPDEATSTVTASSGLDIDGSRCDFDGFYAADRAGARTLLGTTVTAAITTSSLSQQILACERGEVKITALADGKGGLPADATV